MGTILDMEPFILNRTTARSPATRYYPSAVGPPTMTRAELLTALQQQQTENAALRAELGVAQAACGVAAVIGHNFSPFLNFRGGKGVATTFGTICALLPVAGLGFFLMGITTVWLTRFVSAGSILGALTGAFTAYLLGAPLWLSLVVSALAALIVWQHRENIRKLHAGNERRFGEKVSGEKVS